MSCFVCEDVGWVCEIHPDYPWDGTCPCGGPGAPCPRCNVPVEGQPPRMPEGFRTVFDQDGWRH